MSKAVLEFELPEENEEFKLANNGAAYCYVITEILQHLRSKLKYEELTDEQYHCYEEIREFIYQELKEHDLQA